MGSVLVLENAFMILGKSLSPVKTLNVKSVNKNKNNKLMSLHKDDDKLLKKFRLRFKISKKKLS